jgi:hypothetical protein
MAVAILVDDTLGSLRRLLLAHSWRSHAVETYFVGQTFRPGRADMNDCATHQTSSKETQELCEST